MPQFPLAVVAIILVCMRVLLYGCCCVTVCVCVVCGNEWCVLCVVCGNACVCCMCVVLCVVLCVVCVCGVVYGVNVCMLRDVL